jgi:hypothetical protein
MSTPGDNRERLALEALLFRCKNPRPLTGELSAGDPINVARPLDCECEISYYPVKYFLIKSRRRQ